jgi:hypothetical protein
MVNWKAILQESPVDYLLEEDNPSVRYFTLRDILGKEERDSKVTAAKHAIADSPIVKKIFQKQMPNGYWNNPANPYLPKYKSSYWQIMVLGQLGMDRTDERVRKACDYVFGLQLEEGGFSSFTLERGLEEYEVQLRRGKKLSHLQEFASSFVHEHQYSCLTGNMAAALTRISYGEDLRVKKALEWLVKVQNIDGGWLCPYWCAHMRDKHGCFYGTICALEAFSEVNGEQMTKTIEQTVEKGAEFMLMHRLFKADHHDFKVINPSWLSLGFPFFYSYSILRGLDVLTRLGYNNDERLDDAVEILLRKRQKDGKWVLESSPVGRMHANIEAKGKPSKWITLIALRVMKRLGSN